MARPSDSLRMRTAPIPAVATTIAIPSLGRHRCRALRNGSRGAWARRNGHEQDLLVTALYPPRPILRLAAVPLSRGDAARKITMAWASIRECPPKLRYRFSSIAPGSVAYAQTHAFPEERASEQGRSMPAQAGLDGGENSNTGGCASLRACPTSECFGPCACLPRAAPLWPRA